METKEAIFSRRSVRKFTDEIVTDEEIAELLDAARWAPSWANLQAWEFIVVKDREMIQKVTDTYSATNPARKCSASASVVLVICSKTGVSGYKEGVQADQVYQLVYVLLWGAVENICLRACIWACTSLSGPLTMICLQFASFSSDGFEVVAAVPAEGPPCPSGRPLAKGY
jgi:nitroreductase